MNELISLSTDRGDVDQRSQSRSERESAPLLHVFWRQIAEMQHDLAIAHAKAHGAQ